MSDFKAKMHQMCVVLITLISSSVSLQITDVVYL